MDERVVRRLVNRILKYVELMDEQDDGRWASSINGIETNARSIAGELSQRTGALRYFVTEDGYCLFWVGGHWLSSIEFPHDLNFCGTSEGPWIVPSNVSSAEINGSTPHEKVPGTLVVLEKSDLIAWAVEGKPITPTTEIVGGEHE